LRAHINEADSSFYPVVSVGVNSVRVLFRSCAYVKSATPLEHAGSAVG